MPELPKILIIEDDIIYQETLSRFLENLGSCIFASTLGEARQAMAKHDDIAHALVDYRLPDGNGTEILPELADRNVPSTFMSFLSPETLKADLQKAPDCIIVNKEDINKEYLTNLLAD